MSKRALKGDARINGAAFTLSQLRLICTRSSGQDRFAGDAINVYPIGHLKAADQIQVASEIRVKTQGFDGYERPIDLVFNIPSGYDPVAVEYKMNSIVEIAPTSIVTDPSKIPAPATFNAVNGEGGNQNRNNPNRNQQSQSSQQQSSTDTSADRRSGLSDTSRSIVGPGFEE